MGVPYAMYHLGLIWGIFSVVLVGYLNHQANMFYLKTALLTPNKSESLYEISFVLFGRASIFVLCSMLIVLGMGSGVIFYCIIGDA